MNHLTSEQSNLVLSWKALGFNFYTCIATILFQKKPIDVTGEERDQAKTQAYKDLYG